MSYRACFTVALAALTKNKMRTILTMLGLMIGVATVLTMFALGSGAQAAIETQVKAAGMNLITVASGNHLGTVEDDTQKQGIDSEDGGSEEPAPVGNKSASTETSAPAPTQSAEAVQSTPSAAALAKLNDPEADLGIPAKLALGDASAIRGISGVQFVSEGLHTNVRLKAGTASVFTRLNGDNTSLQEIRRAWKLDKGRFYTEDEQSKGEQVMVLGAIAADQLFGTANPVGQTVTFWNQPFRVVGVVGSGSWMVTPKKGDDQFDAAYVPFTTLHKLLGMNGVSDITISVAAAGEVTRITKAVTTLLRQRHNIHSPEDRDDFTVTSQARKAISAGGMRREMAKALVGNMDILDRVTLEQMSKTLERASRTMTALLASVAAVSLLVGGIGIMNIMLLSVTERTREIGIRRAIGARSRDVLRQFLMEAATLSIMGGLLGVMLGIASSVFISRWAAWSTSISGVAIAVAFGSAAAIGIFFGYYPARQASEVAPMESLRYE